ncbi:hypothetical protein ZIOFF_068004 [Zingiber officinale]|uniref:peptidylprolyl isomerase n=1 Tax=Zingiber officinale TaxID=94328 RepID=A0A8J5ET36_ZINOF|nr:hypothetical protein ZIOFF_068004 [Zingiber officinale]
MQISDPTDIVDEDVVSDSDLAVAVPFVCKSWYRASLDPSCWRRLNFRSLDFTPWSPFSHAFALRYCLHSPLSFSAFLRFTLHCSRGVVDQLAFPLSSAVSIHDLAYASVKFLRLKALALPDNLMLEDDLRIPELVRRWKDLEHLEMEIVGIFAPPILSSSRSCNLSFAIPISLPKPLSFATSSLPRLHSPPSRNPGPFRAQVSVSAAQKTKDRFPANLIVTETKGPHSTIRLSVEVPPAISQECYGEVLDEFSKKAKVPGFRQGKKVPENILLNYIGRQNIQQAVVEATLKKTLPHAMSSFCLSFFNFNDKENSQSDDLDILGRCWGCNYLCGWPIVPIAQVPSGFTKWKNLENGS